MFVGFIPGGTISIQGMGTRNGVVVIALASHLRGPGSGHEWVVGCWFFSLLREVFLRVLRFSPLIKSQHFQIPESEFLIGSRSFFSFDADVSIEILDELDLTHLRATGLQSNEEELPEQEQAAAAGKSYHFPVLFSHCLLGIVT